MSAEGGILSSFLSGNTQVSRYVGPGGVTVYKSPTTCSFGKCVEALAETFGPALTRAAREMVMPHDQDSFTESRAVDTQEGSKRVLFVRGTYTWSIFSHLKTVEMWVEVEAPRAIPVQSSRATPAASAPMPPPPAEPTPAASAAPPAVLAAPPAALAAPSATPEPDTMRTAYVLELKSHKWYIGKAADVRARFAAHVAGTGAQWTKVFEPLRIATVIVGGLHDEENAMLDYCCRYGVENVRGGSFTKLCPPPEELAAMTRRVRAHLDLCFNCGLPGHAAQHCIMRPVQQEQPAPQTREQIVAKAREHEQTAARARDIRRPSAAEVVRQGIADVMCSSADESTVSRPCFRCGRRGHWAPDCFAKTTIKGIALK